MKPRLAISFSGGRTSAVMTADLLWRFADSHDIVVTFANTGCEHEATLDFVNNCDKHFGFQTVWMEAEVTEGARVGVRPKIVTYETASRNGEPFIDGRQRAIYDADLDVGGACGESCEIGADQ